MSVDTLALFRRALILIAMMAPGFVLRKLDLMDGKTAKGVSNLILYAAQPAMLLVLFIRPYDPSVARTGGWVLLFSFIAHALFFLMSLKIFDRAPERRRRVFRFASVFGNAGYMGIPIVTAALGDEAGIYVSVYIVTFNIFAWSLGCLIYSGDRAYMSLKKILINPATIPIFFGLLFFFLPIDGYVPAAAVDALNMLKSVVAPLSMTVIGIRLAEADLKAGLRDKYLALSVAMRLLVMPAAVWALMRLAGLAGIFSDRAAAAVVLICAATPPAAATGMFAEKFGGDTAAASTVVAVGTVLSVATIPLVSLLLKI